MFECIDRWLWRRSACKALKEGLTTSCAYCSDPIIPGDIVSEGTDNEKNPILVHAGAHFSLTKPMEFCETGALANGTWTGTAVKPFSHSP